LVILLSTVSCGKNPALGDDHPGTETKPTGEIIQEADGLYDGREDLLKVRQAILELRQAQVQNGGDYDIGWRLAKMNYYLGSHSADEGEKDKAFRDGIKAGQTAVRLQSDKPDGHFWLGANYGGAAEMSAVAGLSSTDDIKREMETVIKLDEGYQAGSAYMVLGQVYLESPRLLGGDSQQAILYFEKGLRFGPDNELLRLHLAEAYLAVNRKEDARKQLDALRAMKPDREYLPEHKEALAEAQKLEGKLK
jgi:tetratricopeptide (TPR) repeat protein